MTTDLTFITNENGQSLLERFKVLLGNNTRFFDCLVGYFYSSGFYSLIEHFENTERIRILIGISTDHGTLQKIRAAEEPLAFQLSHAQTKEIFSEKVVSEMSAAPDSEEVETGVTRFVEWIRNGKLQFKAYPSGNLHAKLYVLTFADGDRDLGRVITGSSNFTQSGLKDNLEFNVELKQPADYRFAQNKFNELWETAVDVSEQFVNTVNHKTWLNPSITPYEIYLKFLYEYFRKDLSRTEDLDSQCSPQGFKRLEYQEQAVASAKRILEEYGGVFLSDVVGLGKTYISAMLASQLDGRTLVIAPPLLLSKDNPNSWRNVFFNFRVSAEFESIGKIEDLARRSTDHIKTVILDESHRHRNEGTKTYKLLKQICWGKRVILVSATPLNNTPNDIRSQIALFQKTRKSTIPNLPDLHSFFVTLGQRLKKVNRKTEPEKYRKIVAENAKEVRERVLKYLMVRRTRSEVSKYFNKDLVEQNVKFPVVNDPTAAFYALNKDMDFKFRRSIQLITSPDLKYSRYKPGTYLNEQLSSFELQQQVNLSRFMKVLLVKRLDSSFHAFRNTLKRFVASYEHFIDMYRRGYVFLGKGLVDKVFELIEEDRLDDVENLICAGKVEKHESSDFKEEFLEDLERDLGIFRDIAHLWASVSTDPKLEKLIELLKSDRTLADQTTKIILFTESKETAEYLAKNLQEIHAEEPLLFTGGSGEATRLKVTQNFDARANEPQDDFRLLITTDVLAEGVNLHRSNVVVNYDIPWNPTKMMQRVGRVNRIDTGFDEVFTYNFFPTVQADSEIKLADAARAKIEAFIQMLGADAKLLTEDEEITSHDLFSKLNSKASIEGEDEQELSELKYFQVIKDIRDYDIELFDRIKKLPKKARTGREEESETEQLVAYIRKSPLEKFFVAEARGVQEIDFFQAAEIFETEVNTPRVPLGASFYELLAANKQQFEFSVIEDVPPVIKRVATDNSEKILRILKSNDVRFFKGYTETDEEYIRQAIRLLEEGTLPPRDLKNLKDRLEKAPFEPLQILGILKTQIADEFFQDTPAEERVASFGPLEVVLSEYLAPRR